MTLARQNLRGQKRRAHRPPTASLPPSKSDPNPVLSSSELDSTAPVIALIDASNPPKRGQSEIKGFSLVAGSPAP